MPQEFIDRRAFVRRIFAMGAGFAVGGSLIRQVPQLLVARKLPPSDVIVFDSEVLGHFALHDDDYVYFANGSEPWKEAYLRGMSPKRSIISLG